MSASIPVSKAEFMKLISRIEHLEAEISLFRNWIEKKYKAGNDHAESKITKIEQADEDDSENENSSSSYKRLLAGKKL
jgi:hypothetical protein